MYKYAFVILHYETIEVTKECVQSIQKYYGKNECEIVIVDNGSKNKSGVELQKEYQEIDNIHVLINQQNLGFARGNNVGYRFAKHTLKSDFIMLVNSDTQVTDANFLPVIAKKYEETNYAVMGPLITKNGVPTNDNPRREGLFLPSRIKMFILLNQIQYWLSYLGLDAVIDWLFKKYADLKRTKENSSLAESECKENVGLHGCCFVLSPVYQEHFEGLNEKTFMYLEEEILQFEVIKKGLKTLYCPELRIEHAEGYTTSKVNKRPVEKRRFLYENSIKSAKVLLALWRENNE